MHTAQNLLSLDSTPESNTLYILSDKTADFTHEGLRRFISLCEEKRSTALILQSGFYDSAFDIYSRDLLSKAEVPIVVADTSLDGASIALEVLQYINSFILDQFQNIIDVNTNFARRSLQNKGIESMIPYFKEVIGNPVAIHDETFNCIFSSDPFMQNYGKVKGSSTYFFLNNLYFTKQNVLISIDGEKEREYPLVSFPISYKNKARAYLSVLESNKILTKVDYVILEIAATSILMEMKHALAIRSIEEKNINSLFYNLFYQKNSITDELLSQAQTLGIPDSADYIVLTMEATAQEETFSAPKTLGSILVPTIEEEVFYLASKHIHEIRGHAIAGSLGKTIIAVCRVEDPLPELFASIKDCYETIKKELLLHYKSSTLRCGVGSVAHGIRNSAASYENANNALVYGKIIYGEQRDFTIFYNDTSILKLISSVGSREALDEIIPESLKTLKAYDREHQSNLLHTLSAYFDANCNVKQAAQQMLIHYKTMIYRLDKIKKLCQIDLSDSDERLHLALGLKIINLLFETDAYDS